MAELPPAEIADICRNPQDPRWLDAWQSVGEVFGRVARKHPLTKRLKGADKEDRILELAHEFWIYLCENPAALRARSTLGKGALWTESWRFLDRLPASDEHDQIRVMKRHLHTKIRETLRGESAFELAGRFWYASHPVPAGQEPYHTEQNSGLPLAEARALSDREIVRLLRPLASDLKPQRAGQLPPIVRKDHLFSFLLRVFQAARRPMVDWELNDIAWNALEPHPRNVFAVDTRSSAEQGSEGEFSSATAENQEGLVLRKEWAGRIDVLASSFVAATSARAAKIAVRRRARLTVREISKETGFKRGIVANEIKYFEERFGAVVEHEELSQDEARELILLILDILEVEAFSNE